MNDTPCTHHSKAKTEAILGIVIPLIAVLMVAALILLTNQ